ncbi:MAG: M20/M25/M40 family metallo-hydrolase [Gemmatimonadaceae bacterium]|nr:M20/M25/M40 family metallo-hydrolase [Gemmatimonadaceae bacterium]
MKKIFLSFFILAAFSASSSGAQTAPLSARYKDAADRIIAAALADSFAYDRTAKLTDTFGHRLSGSQSLELAIDWILAEMRADGFQNVRGEKVMVPRWVRGNESATLIAPRPYKLHMIGLGRSVATPRAGITAPVIVVSNYAELAARRAEVKGKIVLFNVPFTGYGQTVRYRGSGADSASKFGAVAMLLRSVSSASMQNPHTGAMGYDTTRTARKIPAAAISVEDAMMLARMAARGEKLTVNLKMEAHTLPDVPSRNVVAEIVGSEKPNEVVVLGGHIDSWDIGQGAMDDAGGCVAAWEAVRLIKRLGLKPKRTIRVVLWTNEENGLRGGNGYRDAHITEIDNHILAMESDGGVFKPLGFGASTTEAGMAMFRDMASLLAPIGATQITPGGADADTGPIIALGVPGLSLNVDGTKYFWYHHSAADMMDKLDPREVGESVAAMAVMAYIGADMPERIPRVVPTASPRNR